MTVHTSSRTLGHRLGLSTHVSPLRFKLKELERRYPSSGATCLEDWLVDVANSRGARIICRERLDTAFVPPPEDLLSTEELVIAMCQLQCIDRPQMLRLAAQFVSRKAVNVRSLKLIATRERTRVILAELARQAIKVDPEHEIWTDLLKHFGAGPNLKEPILHWTRLAEPVPANGRYNAASWRLVE